VDQRVFGDERLKPSHLHRAACGIGAKPRRKSGTSSRSWKLVSPSFVRSEYNNVGLGNLHNQTRQTKRDNGALAASVKLAQPTKRKGRQRHFWVSPLWCSSRLSL